MIRIVERLRRKVDGVKWNGNGAQETATAFPGVDLGSGWLHDFGDQWGRWDGVAAEVGQESQARVILTGLTGAGKSTLFNWLRGWIVSLPEVRLGEQGDMSVEAFGAFALADLPESDRLPIEDLLSLLGDPALVVYLLDGRLGVTQSDFRWIAHLRASGRPLVIAVNKSELVADPDALLAEVHRRVGVRAVAISAQDGLNVEEALLPAMLDAAPHLAVTLGREVGSLRRQAARRVIRRAALFAGMLSAQPLPVLDIPAQIAIQAGVMMRVGAAYGHAPANGISREVLVAGACVLCVSYLTQTLLKFVPLLGWAINAVLGAVATWLLGEVALFLYERAERTARNERCR